MSHFPRSLFTVHCSLFTVHCSLFTVHCSLFSLLCLSSFAAFSEVLPNDNVCYFPSVRTIQVHKEGNELSPPVIQLNSTEHLAISFDDLDQDVKGYRFTIIHCESDWSTSKDLTISDYIDGYREENINQYAYSYNTTVRYIHFSATFPTETMRPKISGNYILVVFDEDTTRVAFTARFMVVETSQVASEGKVVQGSRMEDRFNRQQIDFTVKLNGFLVRDIQREIRVVVQQNGRWDNALMLTKPRFSSSTELDYRYDEAISFNGGNQFRNFDTKSLKYQSERIAHIGYDTANQVFLVADMPRSFKQYAFEKDLNGKFYIKNEDYAENSSVEADYTWVHFFLPYPAVLTTGDFYVLGELSRWGFGDGNRMKFNYERRGYELSMFLKQGYYNYIYALKEKGKTAADESLIEGSHWETENDYTIYVYYHETGSQYDRLMAVNYLNTIEN